MATPLRYRVQRFLVDGEQFFIRGDVTINPGTMSKERVTGPDGHVGNIEMPISPSIAGTIVDTPGLDVIRFRSFEGVTVVAELANGKTWVFRNSDQINAEAMNLSNGEIPFEFSAESAEEIAG